MIINKMKISSPCVKDCPRRNYKCHFTGNCKEYDEYKAKLDAVNKKRKEDSRRLYG